MKALKLQGWAGIRYEAVEIVGETPKRLRVKILEENAKLAGRCRYAKQGEIVLVPRYAVVEITENAYREARAIVMLAESVYQIECPGCSLRYETPKEGKQR